MSLLVAKSIGWSFVCVLAARAALPAESPSAEEPPAASSMLPWLATLEEGYRQALDRRRPVLVRIQTRYCSWCRKLEAEMAKPQIQDELSRWTLVDLDADRSPDEAARLAMQSVPALRVLTSRGRLVASHEGYLSAEELLVWLRRERDAVGADPDDVLLDGGEPDVLAVLKLTRLFGNRDPTIRAASMRRLVAYPVAAAPAVIKVFRDGNLATRLTALELLDAWRAPVGGIDPWRPETLTPLRTAALEEWVEDSAGVKVPASDQVTPDQLAEARAAIRRMIAAPSDEADAIRERLAVFGQGLLPEIYEQLARAEADLARERLLTLRYRLAADDSRVLSWEGGLVRLAATESRVRQRAAEELAGLADDRDRALLLELFGDPDPLVREISLRALQQIGGREATAALVKLLKDPAPNVRAAVLKQILENPRRSMVPKVAEYVQSEEDADLIGHAIRFLQAAGGERALRSLILTLKHPQWQVRAEAAEAIGTLVQSSGYGNLWSNSYGSSSEELPQELVAEGYVSLIELLDDSDPFVVSRSVTALESADMELAVQPLAEAAERHPELATTIVGILVRGEDMRDKAVPHLREFAEHEDPPVRAAAIRGLVEAQPDEIGEELAASLKDPASEVRVAAAEAVFESFDEPRQSAQYQRAFGGSDIGLSSWAFRELAGSVSPETLREMLAEAARSARGAVDGVEEMDPGPSVEPVDETDAPTEASDETDETDETDKNDAPAEESWDGWLEKHYARKNWPESIAGCAGLLEGMLKAETAEERLAAALALVPMGRAEIALSVVVESARSKPGLLDRAASVLPWLGWEARLATFRQLSDETKGSQNRTALIGPMASIPDRRAADVFWELLADETLTVQDSRPLASALYQAYLGNHYRAEDAPIGDRRELVRAAELHATEGTDMERRVSLALLTAVDPERGGEIAARLAENPALTEEVRLAAFQTALAARPEEEACEMALAALNAEDPKCRLPALRYLAEGRSAMASGPEGFGLPRDSREVSWAGEASSKPIVPLPPAKLEAEHVRPLLEHPDPQTAAYAGYLLALFEEPEGLDPLLAYWRDHVEKEPELDWLVYRAIASLDATAHVALLERIYERLDSHDVGQFYWTVRIMSGPKVLRLRKKIRDAVGMENLR